jgi:hypothetical protein
MKRSSASRDVASSSGQGARNSRLLRDSRLLKKVSGCNLLQAPATEKLRGLVGNALAELHGAGSADL